MTTVLKPKIELPERFSGTDSADPQIWLSTYELHSRVAGWAENDMIKYFPMFLTDTAHTWYITCGQSTDWKVLRQTFLKTFALNRDATFPERSLVERSFREGYETVRQYYFDKLRLCINVDPDMDVNKKIQHLISGLPLRWQNTLVSCPPLTLDDLLDKILVLCENENKSASISSATVFSVDVLKEVVASEVGKAIQACSLVQQQSIPVSENTSNNNNSANSTFVWKCQICNRIGHSARYCYQRYKSNRGNYNNSRGSNNNNRSSRGQSENLDQPM